MNGGRNSDSSSSYWEWTCSNRSIGFSLLVALDVAVWIWVSFSLEIRLAKGRAPMKEYRAIVSPPVTLSSRKLSVSFSFRKAETGVSRSPGSSLMIGKSVIFVLTGSS